MMWRLNTLAQACSPVALSATHLRISWPRTSLIPTGIASLMNEDTRHFRPATRTLIALSLALGIIIGVAVGAGAVYFSIDRVVVITLTPGVEV